MKSTSSRNLKGKVAFVIILSLILLTVIASFSDFRDVIGYLRDASLIYIGISVIFLLLYSLTYPYQYVAFAKANNFDISNKDAYIIGGSEFFYNFITPFQSGGQPFIIYKFNKFGIKPYQSSGMMITLFFVSQISFMLFGAVSVVFNTNMINNELSHLSHWIIIGFIINFFYLFFVIAIGTSVNFRKFVVWILKGLSKIGFLKNFLEKKIPEFESFTVEAQRVFKEMAKSKLEMFTSLLIKIICLTLLYSIPFFAFLSVGVDIPIQHILLICAMTSITMTMASWAFTPGAAGAVEFFFIAIFGVLYVSTGYATDAQIIAALLIWRVSSFYGLFAVGSIFNMFSTKRLSAINKQEIITIKEESKSLE